MIRAGLSIPASIVRQKRASGKSDGEQPGNGQHHANRQTNDQRDNQVNGDGRIVRLTGLAVVSLAALSTFDVRQQLGTQQTAPPGKADSLSKLASAGRAGSEM